MGTKNKKINNKTDKSNQNKKKSGKNEASQEKDIQLSLYASEGLEAWLMAHKVSLAFTSRQANQLFLVGVDAEEKKLSIFGRMYPRCTALCATSQRIYLASLFQCWHLENALSPDQKYQPMIAYLFRKLPIPLAMLGFAILPWIKTGALYLSVACLVVLPVWINNTVLCLCGRR